MQRALAHSSNSRRADHRIVRGALPIIAACISGVCDDAFTSIDGDRIRDSRIDTTRVIRAPRGTELSCKSWLTEAAFRMLQNNLDPDVAENPAELVVYGGIGRAARNWECFDAILRPLRELGDDETLLIQSADQARPVAS